MPISHSYLDRHASPTKRNNNHERAANPHKTTSLAALADSHAAMTEHAAIIGLRSGESRSELIERVKKEQRPAWLQDLASDTSHIGVPSLDPPVVSTIRYKEAIRTSIDAQERRRESQMKSWPILF